MYTGPNIERDGLVFGYDTGRNPSSDFDHKSKQRRFFKGKVTTNVVTNTNLNTGWSKGYQTAILYDEIKPPKGVNSQVVGFNKNRSSSYWYSYGNYAPQTPNTTYTVSLYVKTRDSNFRIRFYTANNSETGRVWGSYITVPNDNKWHRIVWPSFLNPSNSQSDSLSFNFVMADTGDSSRTWFCAPQMEVGTEVSPFVDGTRSSTQSLIDLTKTTNIDVSNVSFNSNGFPTFDGTDDFINLPNDLGYDNEVSIFAVFKSNGTPAGGYHIICGGQELEISVPTAGQLRTGIYTTSRYVNNLGSGLTDGNYHHIGFTFSNNTKTAYIDGVLVGTQSTSGNLTNSFPNRRLGRFGSSSSYYLNGELPVLKIYNRALSAAEVQQNFKAYKNRFNI